MAEKGNIERLYRIERDASGEEIKRTLANPITHAQAVIMDDGRTLSESMSTGKVEVDIRLNDSGELEYLNGDEWVVAGKETEVYNKDFVATEGQNEFKVDKGIGEKSNLLNVYVNGLKQAEGFAKFIDAQTLKTSVKLNAGDYLNVQYFQVAGGKLDGIPNATKDNDGLMPKEVFSRLGDLNELETGKDTTLVESINTINKKAESMTESLMFTEDFTKDKIKGDTTSLSQPVKLSSATTDIFINGIRQPFNIIEPLPGGKFKLIPELKEDDVLTIRYVAPKDIIDVDTVVTGDLGNLNTTDKSNLVNAVNEVKESSWSKDELIVGGRNLFLNSDREIKETTDYKVAEYRFTEPMIDGVEYVFSIDLKLNMEDWDRTNKLSIYNSGEGVASNLGEIIFNPKEYTEYNRLKISFVGKEYHQNVKINVFVGAFLDKVRSPLSTRNAKLEKGNIATDWTPAPEDIQEDIKNLKQSVSDGKQKVAVAITDKGIKTAADATFDTMARNISDITTDPSKGTTDAIAADILSGKKVVSKGELITGTMGNHGALNKTITTQGGKQIITPGYYEGGEVKAQFNNLTASNVKKGINIGGITGSYAGGTKVVKTKATSSNYSLNESKVTVTMNDNTVGVQISIYINDSPNGWYARVGEGDLVFFRGDSYKSFSIQYTGFDEKFGDWSEFYVRASWSGNKVTFTPKNEYIRLRGYSSTYLISLE